MRIANENILFANAHLNKKLYSFYNQRYCKDKLKYRNTETYVWLQTQEGGFCDMCGVLEAFLFFFFLLLSSAFPVAALLLGYEQ